MSSLINGNGAFPPTPDMTAAHNRSINKIRRLVWWFLVGVLGQSPTNSYMYRF